MTARTTRAQKSATAAPAFVPATNPLPHQDPEDTMRAVAEVLGFIGHAILSDAEQEAVEYKISSGLFSIINVCQSALKAHLTAEGGAA